MSHETSPSTQQPYGIARVTRVWQVPRSTVYARRDRRDHPSPAAKRGPKTPWTDAALTAHIRTIIAESPFHGEGHRKIWAGIVRLIRLDPKNLQSRTIRLQVDATRPGRRRGFV